MGADACPQLNPALATQAAEGQGSDSPTQGRLGEAMVGVKADHSDTAENKAGSQSAAERGTGEPRLSRG